MRKLSLILIVTIFFTSNIIAQVPQKLSYQAVIRNTGNDLITNTNIGMQVSILQGSSTGTAVYTETHTASTNENGLVTIEIGDGTPVSGTFAGINWSTGTYFLKTEIDLNGGSSYTIEGTSQILSVPYAFYANNIKLNLNGRPSYLYIKDDGTLAALPYITVEKPYNLIPSVTDVDGNVYTTVKIGTQIWMCENLKTTKYNDNVPIPLVEDLSIWNVTSAPAYCWYNNDISNKTVYGALYNWYVVNTNKLCPTGWHVPTNEEFNALITYLLPAAASGRLREFGRNAINDSKFTAVPGGNRFNNQNDFNSIGQAGLYWTKSVSTEPTYAFRFQISAPGMDYNIDFGSASVGDGSLKEYGSSVRCIKD